MGNDSLENRISQLESQVQEIKTDKRKKPVRSGLILALLLFISVFLYSQYRLNRNQQELLKEQNRIAEMQAGFNQFQIVQELYKTEATDTVGIDDLFVYITELDTGTRRKFLERILDRETRSYLSQESFKHYFSFVNPASAEYFVKHARSFDLSYRSVRNRYVIPGENPPEPGDNGFIRQMQQWFGMEYLPVGNLSFDSHIFLNSPGQGYTDHIARMISHITMNINMVYARGRLGDSSMSTLPRGSFQLLKDIDALVEYMKGAAFYSPPNIRDYVDIGGYEGVGNKVLFDLQDPYLTATYRDSRFGFSYLRGAAQMRYNIYQAYFRKSQDEEQYLKNLPFLIAFLDYEQDLRQEYIVEALSRPDYQSYADKLNHLMTTGYDSLKSVFDETEF